MSGVLAMQPKARHSHRVITHVASLCSPARALITPVTTVGTAALRQNTKTAVFCTTNRGSSHPSRQDGSEGRTRLFQGASWGITAVLQKDAFEPFSVPVRKSRIRQQKLNGSQSSSFKHRVLWDTDPGALTDTTGYTRRVSEMHLLERLLLGAQICFQVQGQLSTRREQHPLCKQLWACGERLPRSAGGCSPSRGGRRGQWWGGAAGI